MTLWSRSLRRSLLFVLLVALIASACGGDDSSDTESEAASQAAGTLGDVDLSSVVNEIEQGFGTLGRAQRQAMLGVVDGAATCTDASIDRARPAPSQIEVEIISVLDGCLVFSYDVANFRGLIDDLDAIRNRPNVIAVSPMLIEYRLDQVQSPWPIEAIDGLAAFAEPDSPTGQGVVVALIDSGIDATHPALNDVSISRSPDSGTGDYTETGHGTVAASVMVAPIGQATRAIAPAIELLDVPADLCAPADCGCDPCAPMTPAEAIRWSTDNGAHVISMSFGFLPAPKPAWWQLLLDAGDIASSVDTLQVSLAYAQASGVSMVAAAGNCAAGPNARCESEDQFELPAGHRGVIGVAASAADDSGEPVRAAYSTRQTYVELAAPGNLMIVGPDGEPIQKNGTSYATPFVSAALAILMGSDGPLAEQSDAGAVARDVLATTAIDVGAQGRDPEFGYGQLQLGAAIDAAAQLEIEAADS